MAKDLAFTLLLRNWMVMLPCLSFHTAEVPESPLVVPLRLDVVAQIYGVYLPLVQRQ